MLSSLLSNIATRLVPVSDTPDLDASVLIAHILGKPRTWVLAHPELTLTSAQQEQLDESLARLEYGEAFPYVLGHWEFFGLDFDITPDVLIPRPETELLVEKAVVWLQESPRRRTVADIGTGSGAIAVSIAVNVSDAMILATDISPKALEVARTNAVKFEVIDRIDFVQCDLLPHPHASPALHGTCARGTPVLAYGARECAPGASAGSLSPWDDSSRSEAEWRSGEGVKKFDLICANLPYVPADILRNLPVFGREPTLALDGGLDGLDIIRRLLTIGPNWLASNGIMLLEIEATRGIHALNLACDVFSKGKIHLHQDLAGRDRLLEIRP